MNYVIYWLLPSLIIMILMIEINRFSEDIAPEEYYSEEWIILTIMSILYPIGFFLILGVTTPTFIKFLIKERRFKK